MSLSRHDYEVYKAGVEKLVYKYLNRDRSSAASVITHAVDSGADKRKLAEKLASVIDKAMAEKLSEKSFSLLDKLGIKLKPRKRGFRDDIEEVTDASTRENKKPRTDISTDLGVTVAAPPVTTKSSSLHQKDIQDILAKAQATIEERKKALASINSSTGVAPQPTQNVVPASNGASKLPAPAASSVSSRIAELQARIRSQMGTVSSISLPPVLPVGQLPPPQLLGVNAPMPTVVTPNDAPQAAPPKVPGERPPPIILDSEGRTLDLTGKEVHIASRVPTLKANIRAKKREEFKMQLAEKPGVDEFPDNDFFDNRVAMRPAHRQKRMAFSFHEKGKYVQLAQRERAKSRLEKLQSEIVTAARRTGITSATRLAQLQGDIATDQPKMLATPNVEWWDAVILGSDSYPAEDDKNEIQSEYITNLIEHPLEMKCPSENIKPVDLKVYLTAKERKKLRRMNRREAWKEKQDKIRLGLEPPPEPKVRMANLMRVLGTDAVLDPTKMEKHVRDQMAKRKKAHEDANEARKLTPQQRKEKKIAKLKEDTSNCVNVSVYRVTDLSNGSHKFKVETNAKQLFMTGVVVLFQDVNVVVVEGGPKQQRKYRQLMLNRIKWLEEARSNSQSNVEPKCQLVWEGTVLERNFGEMQFKACPSESFARDHLKRHGVEHYWDMAYGQKLAEEAEQAQL